MFLKFKRKSLVDSSFFRLNLNFEDDNETLNVECLVVGSWILECDPWLEQMTRARELNKTMFFARFPPSIDSLKKYLKQGAIENPNQILFLFVDQNGELLGHIGLKMNTFRNFEVDNVLRVSFGAPSLMSIMLGRILEWAIDELDPEEFSLKVMSTNLRAISLYEKHGFVLSERCHLKIETFTTNTSTLVPSDIDHSNTSEEMFTMKKTIFKAL
jgi:RimJ/RimL family protein N-acetyltransferase